jgi:hypothetical protein
VLWRSDVRALSHVAARRPRAFRCDASVQVVYDLAASSKVLSRLAQINKRYLGVADLRTLLK